MRDAKIFQVMIYLMRKTVEMDDFSISRFTKVQLKSNV